MVVPTIETRETTASDSSSDHRDYWCTRDAPQPLVSNDSSPPAKTTTGSPEIHYRTPWPMTSPVVKKVSLQSSPPTTGNWPQRSPIKPEHEHEVASFALFTQSFDTLSDTGHCSLRHSPEHPPRKIQLAETEDISPIKLQEYKSSRQYVEAIPPNFRPHDTSTYHANGYSDTASNPFFVLRSVARAFDHCAYQLPCLYDGEICPVNLSRHSTVHRYQEAVVMGEKQLERARRRVDSAIYAFGGYTQRSQAIFRSKPYAKEHYDNCFHRRYIVAGDHISWELEHHPPIRLPTETSHSELHVQESMQDTDGPNSTASTVALDANQQKMRYRCKLCGQLKQNHNCPYQQSLQRSIAVMVYPTVTAYTASEPGILTKPLAEMNNFVSYDDSSEYRLSPPTGVPHITPETKARLLHYSPESSLSTHSDPSPHRTRKRSVPDVATPTSINRRVPHYHVSNTLTLRPEHYRAITTQQQEDYQYPHVPLSFQERKRLSDTLFYMAKEIPTMTTLVGPLLRLAREHDDWDLAVAQILTQLVVALYCAEGDTTLEGLQRYLLMIGIAC